MGMGDPDSNTYKENADYKQWIEFVFMKALRNLYDYDIFHELSFIL